MASGTLHISPQSPQILQHQDLCTADSIRSVQICVWRKGRKSSPESRVFILLGSGARRNGLGLGRSTEKSWGMTFQFCNCVQEISMNLTSLSCCILVKITNNGFSYACVFEKTLSYISIVFYMHWYWHIPHLLIHLFLSTPSTCLIQKYDYVQILD